MADEATSSMRKIQQLQEIFPDANITQSVYATVLKATDNDMDKAIDELLTITNAVGIGAQNSHSTGAIEAEEQAKVELLALMKQQEEAEQKQQGANKTTLAIVPNTNQKEEEQTQKQTKAHDHQQQEKEQQRDIEQQAEEEQKCAEIETTIHQKAENFDEAEELQRVEKQLEILVVKEQALLQKEEALTKQQKEFEQITKHEVAQLQSANKRMKHQELLKQRELERIKKQEEVTNARIQQALKQEYDDRVQQAVLSKESQLKRTIEQSVREQIENEVKQNLEQELRDQIAKEFEIKQLEESSNIPTPVVAIYINDKSAQTTEEVQEIRAFLAAVDVADCDIVTCNLENSTDNELRAFLVEKTGGALSYPIVCIHATPVGKIAQLKKLKAEAKLIPLLNGDATVLDAPAPELKDGTKQIIGRGTFDTCLDAAEYVSATLFWLPVSAITYPFRTATPTLTKGKNDVDFQVTHTNWYYRNLIRLFRFTDDKILRIHPRHMDVRGSHAYDTVESITFTSSTKLVIIYNDSSIPDYITAVAEDCANIADIITSRASHKVIVYMQLDDEILT